MKKLGLFLVCMTIISTVNAQWKKVKGNGKVVTDERSVGEYDQVALAGWFDVDLVKGTEGALTLEGESNLLEYIITEVKGGKLTIKTKRGINLKSTWNKGIRITVPVEQIDGVSLSGSGDIVSKTKLVSDDFKTSISGSGDISLKLDAKSVSASMSGSGDIELTGETRDLDVSVSGSGDVNAYDLDADFVHIQVAGSADVNVTANKTLKARVSGSGDISYKGNPEKVDSKSSGSGDISSY